MPHALQADSLPSEPPGTPQRASISKARSPVMSVYCVAQHEWSKGPVELKWVARFLTGRALRKPACEEDGS